MAECMACWFLAGRMRLGVIGLAEGRGSKLLDMRAVLPDGEAGVEVKAPFREPPVGSMTWLGDDRDKIAQCLLAAEKQFNNDGANILVIAPTLRIPVFAERRVLIRAVYGESVIVSAVNVKEGRLENQRLAFDPHGKFLLRTRPGGKPLKPDGLPANRRVSAILCIEERTFETHPFPADEAFVASVTDRERSELFRIIERNQALYSSHVNKLCMAHDVLVLHNPYAYHPISEATWSDYPQLVRRGDGMVWTDGYDRPV
jgi:hypothetical protein